MAKYCGLNPKGAWALRGKDEASVQEKITSHSQQYLIRAKIINSEELTAGVCVDVADMGFKLDLEDQA